MATGDKSKQNKISAYLLRESVVQPEKVLRDLAKLHSIQFPLEGTPGVFYWTKPKERPVLWRSFFENALPVHVMDELKSRSAAAVLFLQVNGRWFAICFGFGHTLIDGAAIEPEFGLRAGLTAINPDSIRSIEGSSLDRTGSSRRVQTALPSTFVDLGLDSERHLITAVTGEPKSPEDGKRIQGRDAVQWSSKIKLSDLPSKLQDWLSKYQTANLEESFPGWRRMRPVNDKLIVDALDAEMVSRLKSDPHDRIWIAVPEVVDWELVDGFIYGRSPNQSVLPDIDTDSFCVWFGNMEQLTIESLKSEDVSAIVGNGTAKHWKVYKCIYAEIERQDETFSLINGLWFRIDNDFVKTTNGTCWEMDETRSPHGTKRERKGI
jgi:uncharacterized protein (TIGR04141 family)